MIDVLVFSRDRPLQLDGLLSSIDRYAAHLFGEITVLYECSGPLFALGYLDVGKAHPGVRFLRQHEFELDVRRWLDECSHLMAFLCDDDVFVRRAPEEVRLEPDEACYSLRLYGFPGRRHSWPWRTGIDDYGYPLSLDGHVFRRETLLRLIDQPEPPHEVLHFDDPTRLEAGLAARANMLAQDLIAAGERQCLVGIPANRVSPSSGMGYHLNGDGPWAPRQLCERYLEGWRLDLDAMAPALEAATTAHADVELLFRRVRATVGS